MNRLGFEARRIRNVRGWNVVILMGNDIKEDQRLNAHRNVEDQEKVVADLTVTTFVIYVHSATSATYFAYSIRK